MGLLSTDEILERSARELFADCVSETHSSLVQTLIRESLGRVLYISQAHLLTQYVSKDLRTELIETIQEQSFLGRMVIILAGDETPMDRMLTEQPAFAKQFRVQMKFHPLENDACYDILEKQLKAEDIDLGITAREQQDIKDAFQALSDSKQWASVNDIREITNQLIGDAFGKQLEEDRRPSFTGSEILQVLRLQYPQLSRGAENLRRLHEGRQRLGQVISERRAEEAVATETIHADARLTVSRSRRHPFHFIAFPGNLDIPRNVADIAFDPMLLIYLGVAFHIRLLLTLPLEPFCRYPENLVSEDAVLTPRSI